MRAGRRAVGLSLAVAGASLALASPALAADGDLIDVGSELVVVDMPYPGHTSPFAVQARTVADGTVDADLRVRASAPLSGAGSAPLLRVIGPDGQILVEHVMDSDVDQTVSLGPLAEGTVLALSGELSLPSAAGDEWQGVGAEVRIDLLAAQDAPGQPAGPGLPDAPPATGPGLSVTGADLLPGAVLAAVLVVTGVALARHRAASCARSVGGQR